MRARNLRISALLAATLATLAAAMPQAEATITEAAASPARTSIANIESASVTVNWQVERETFEPPIPGTISSPNLRILIGGAVAATLPRSLSRDTPGTTSSETLRFREQVRIPRALVYRAVKEGRAVTLVRRFTDSFDDTFDDAEFEVRPSGDGSAVLSVRRLELAFDDETRSRVLPRGSELRAVAEIKTGGVGLLQVQWDAATGSTTAGTPVFRPLSLVRQGVGGGGRAVITSPPLPTSEEGTHLVRLRVIEPGFIHETPTLQYYVTPTRQSGSLVAQGEILLTGPRPGEALTDETRFSWRALPGADAYQLAFFDAAAGPAEPLDPTRDTQATAAQMSAKTTVAGQPTLAAVFVPAEVTSARLQAFTLAQLPGGKRYLWKVTAIDANGAIIGTSATREIHKP